MFTLVFPLVKRLEEALSVAKISFVTACLQ
jgi:hypothetical protein